MVSHLGGKNSSNTKLRQFARNETWTAVPWHAFQFETRWITVLVWRLELLNGLQLCILRFCLPHSGVFKDGVYRIPNKLENEWHIYVFFWKELGIEAILFPSDAGKAIAGVGLHPWLFCLVIRRCSKVIRGTVQDLTSANFIARMNIVIFEKQFINRWAVFIHDVKVTRDYNISCK